MMGLRDNPSETLCSLHTRVNIITCKNYNKYGGYKVFNALGWRWRKISTRLFGKVLSAYIVPGLKFE